MTHNAYSPIKMFSLRLPEDLYSLTSALARVRGQSLNEFFMKLAEEELRRDDRGRDLAEQVRKFREETRDA